MWTVPRTAPASRAPQSAGPCECSIRCNKRITPDARARNVPSRGNLRNSSGGAISAHSNASSVRRIAARRAGLPRASASTSAGGRASQHRTLEMIGEVYNIGGDNERPNIEIVHQLCALLDDKIGESTAL